VIGIVMAGMAAGNWFGGLLSDRYPPTRILSALFFLAAAGCAAVLPLNAFFGGLSFMAELSWPVRILLHNTGVFVLPAMVLGAITPVVARLALSVHEEAGRTVGTVFAWSVAGSIGGTFLTGYYLVYAFGVREITLASAGVMALLGLFYLVASLRYPGQAAETAAMPPASRADRRALALAYATVFTSNALFMMLELAAARVASRQFGSSVYTWTAVIGIALAGITLGNYLGGRLADRGSSGRLIARLFLLASAAAFFVAPLARLMSYALDTSVALGSLSWPLQIVLHTFTSLFLPCVCIGTISPVVVKRLLESGKAPGSAVGGVYAWGSAGGIFGTFLTGFVLIDLLWSLPVIGLVTAALAVTGLAYAPRKAGLAAVWALLTAALFVASQFNGGLAMRIATLAGLRVAPDPLVVYEDESQYSYLAVLQDEGNPRVRHMKLDKLIHSQTDLDAPLALKYEYEWIYEAVIDSFYPAGAPLNAMVIGGGGYAFPHYLEVARPGGYVETSEIDPAVTHAAHEAFGLPRDTAVHIYDMDARNRVSDLMRLKESGAEVPAFDCVMGDSINDYTVPRHLTTLEFVRQVDALLKPDGFYMLNLIDMLDSGLFLGAVVTTLQEVFPEVHVFNTGRAPSIRDTFVVVCSKVPRDLSGIKERIKQKYDYAGWEVDLGKLLDERRRLMLTDNYAPVDLLLRPVTHTRRLDRSEELFADARQAVLDGKLDEALKLCAQARTYHEGWPALHELMAEIYQKQGNTTERLESLRRALEGNPEPVRALYVFGVAACEAGRREEGYRALTQAAAMDINYLPARVALGTQALKDGRPDIALPQWQDAAILDPKSVSVQYNLGLTLAQMQRYADAIQAWRQAIVLDPSHMDSHHNLALAYHLLKQDAQAMEMVEKIRALGGTPDAKLLEELTPKD
jgi:tetratricopeptide (TPR) repeat protein/MFS family permease